MPRLRVCMLRWLQSICEQPSCPKCEKGLVITDEAKAYIYPSICTSNYF